MAQVPVAEGIFTLPERRPAADRQPLHRVRHRHLPRAGLVPALRVDRDGRAAARRGGAGCGRGRRRTSRRRRRRTRGRRARTSCRSASGYVELPGEVKVETRLTESDPDVLDASAWRWSWSLVPFRTDDDGNEVVTFAFRPVATEDEASTECDVAIVGVGLHPFGRFPGVTGDRHGRDRDPARARRRRRRVARHPVRVRRAATRSTTPTRSSRCSGSPASRSPTCTTAARPRRAR